MSARTLPAFIAGIACLLLAVLPLATEHRSAERPNPEATWRPAPPAPHTTAVHGTALLARQPVAFVPNLGQWDGPFSHKARMGAMTVFLQERGWTFTLVERRTCAGDSIEFRARHPKPIMDSARGVAVGMHFEGGAAPTIPIEEQRLPGVHNYFLGNDPERWRSKVPLHGAVLLTGLYPGIDLRARSQDGHFEYDLLVEPGADLERVVVTVEGAEGLRLDTDGTLIIDTVLGPVRQPLPKTWQVTASGERQEVACRYVLRGVDAFGFEATAWDQNFALVVDPGLVYSSFLGASAQDVASDVVLDAAGSARVCGSTLSASFPTTLGAYDTTYNGNGDVFVTMFDPTGSTLIYSSYLGGSIADWGHFTDPSLALLANGDSVICGWTVSPNFPTTPGAFDTTYNGGWDAFVTRLDAWGSGLIYSTYLGGSGHEGANALALDSNGAVTICGGTVSSNFPTTAGAFDTTYNNTGNQGDAFVTRLDPSGSTLIYSTFLGGATSGDKAYDVALGNAGSATVCGSTQSPDFPTTAGAFDTTYNGGPADVFVARLDPSGSALVYSTFLGGSGLDGLNHVSVAVDATGTATVSGDTEPSSFPTTSGAFSTTDNGGRDVFVTRLDPSGAALIYSTLLGGAANEEAYGLSLSATGAATVCGLTLSSNFPTTIGAFDTTFNGWDAFVTRLDPSGSALSYSTFLGSGTAYAIALGADGTATVCGQTNSATFPTTPATYDTTHNGGQDAFITRLDLGTTIGLSQPGGPGTGVTIDNGYLIPGHEYYNIFSLDLCPAGPGTGPYLGLCVTTLANAQFIVLQASLPVGSPPFHFVATAPSESWGPYIVGPSALDAVCLDVTGGVLGSYSAVARITIQ